MNREAICRQYLEMLQANQVDGIIDLFSTKGQVKSPLYGLMPAADFFRHLSEDTEQSVLQQKGFFDNPQTRSCALLFEYTWTLKNGHTVVFDVVDIFEFNPNNQIEKLTIIYDTYETRDTYLLQDEV